MKLINNAYNLLQCYSQVKRQNGNLNESVDFAFNNSSIKPIQVREEFEDLLNIVQDKKPKVVLEIGTKNGGTFFMFSRVASDDALLISIDYGYWIIRVPLYKSFARNGKKVKLIRTNSHSSKTLQNLFNTLQGKKIDLLFIDGDHSYEGVKRDFEMYSPLVANSGIIAFHDIVADRGGYHYDDYDVKRYWDEIKGSYKHEEIIDDLNEKWGGIGVLIK